MRGYPVEESTTVPVAVTVWADALKEPVIMTSADRIISSEPLQNPFDISFAINKVFAKLTHNELCRVENCSQKLHLSENLPSNAVQIGFRRHPILLLEAGGEIFRVVESD